MSDMTELSHLAVPSRKRTSAGDLKPAAPITGGHVIGPSKKAKLKPSNNTAQLRPYQVRVIDACLQAVRQDGLTRIGVSAPTGSGKTVIFVKLIEELIENQDDKVLILVNSEETANQAVHHTKKNLGMKAGISVGIEKADQRSDSADNV
jgi:superfamily II DNA or RNA helicase